MDAAVAPEEPADAAPPATDGALAEPVDGGADAGDPCDESQPDAGALDREWAAGPLPPADTAAAGYAVRSGVVCDRTTRLVWERAVGPVRTWDDAKTHCDTLSLGGYFDWRLPTRIELLGIVDYGSAPALEAATFPPELVQAVVDGGVETAYWTATPHPQLFLRRYVVSFELGQAFSVAKDLTLAARCVRGGPAASGAQAPAYVTTAGTALDPRTGLRWQRGQVPGSPVTWTEALQACQSLQLDGFSGFRLPTMRELESLYDVRATTGPLWEKSTFSAPSAAIAAAQLWSSNAAGAEALMLSFIPNQSMYPLEKTSYAGARCVTGP